MQRGLVWRRWDDNDYLIANAETNNFFWKKMFDNWHIHWWSDVSVEWDNIVSIGMDSENKLAGKGTDLAVGQWMFNDPDVHPTECANKRANKCNKWDNEGDGRDE